MFLLEPSFADLMLLSMVAGAQADAPAIGWFERHSAIRSTANVGTLDRQALAAWNTAMMLAHPGAVGRT